ncbi:MAG: DUF2975 domain-containing protein [Flavobacterium sp.]|jgi:hypothetical protein|uniref:DUF2975 domain-containing protein n=1 Tax=Flavobacterium sp. TaxID=239 RepID=UPI002FDB271F|nr:DUF2975 domain-containing protein [Bacteroidota bacterium]
MSKMNNLVFKILHVIAWIIFVGLSIEAGGLIVNFVFSVFKPEFVGNLYQKLDLSKLHQQSEMVFFGMYSFILFISILKAILFYVVIQLLIKLDINNPFSVFVSSKISQISQFTFWIGILSFIASQIAKSLQLQGYYIDKLGQFWVDSSAFILMAAIIYIISLIFKRGIELQEENELTI